MNRTIINKRVIDHSRTERILKDIMGKVRNQGAAYMTYTEKMDESKDQAMYSAQYLKGFADKALEDLVAVGRSNMDSFDKLIEEAIGIEEANDSAPLNIADPAIQSAVSIMNTMGEKLDAGTQELIVKTFVGQHNALSLLRAIICKYDLDVWEGNKKYFYQSREIFNSLHDTLYQLASNPKNMMLYSEALKKVTDIAVVLGIELSDSDLEVGIPSDVMQDVSMRSVMGL